jgi:hypothetical protein
MIKKGGFGTSFRVVAAQGEAGYVKYVNWNKPTVDGDG